MSVRLLAGERPEPGQDVAVEKELAARIDLLTAGRRRAGRSLNELVVRAVGAASSPRIGEDHAAPGTSRAGSLRGRACSPRPRRSPSVARSRASTHAVSDADANTDQMCFEPRLQHFHNARLSFQSASPRAPGRRPVNRSSWPSNARRPPASMPRRMPLASRSTEANQRRFLAIRKRRDSERIRSIPPEAARICSICWYPQRSKNPVELVSAKIDLISSSRASSQQASTSRRPIPRPCTCSATARHLISARSVPEHVERHAADDSILIIDGDQELAN